MPIRNVVAMLMAGGQGSRLSILSELRAKPAVPFGGVYRIIDFTMSNCMHSRIPYVGICTQYRPYSLMEHISLGEAWGYQAQRRVARILQPFQAEQDMDWYNGTADAIYHNLNFPERFPDIDHIMILSGDHIYNMNYQEILEFHENSDADLTIAVQEVPWKEVQHYGVVLTDHQDRIHGFEEKPQENAQSNLANLGIYIFKAPVLQKYLEADTADPDSTHDFGRDVIPRMVAEGERVCAFRFKGFWRDVGTIHSYWQANLDVLDPKTTGLNLAEWNVRTNWQSMGVGNQYPARILSPGHAVHSIISRGCVIEGDVIDSILSPGVRVAPGARVERSILMNDVHIGKGAVVTDSVIDKEARLLPESCIGDDVGDSPNNEFPHLMRKGISLVGKRAHVPAGMTFGRNTLIYPYTKDDDFTGSSYPSGATVFNEKYKHRLSAEEFHAPKKVQAV